MKRCWWLALALLLLWAIYGIDAEAQDNTPGKITWKKITLDKNFRSEGVGVADVNQDGKLDVIVGDCWYEAPKEADGAWKRHILRADRVFNQTVYSDSFCCFCDDFNGDGWPDVIVIPYPGNPCFWYENPGAKGGMWKAHLLTNSACNETPIYVDLFKTGKKYLVMGWNPPREDGKGNYDDRGEMCYFVPDIDVTKPWRRISISGPFEKGKNGPAINRFYHGLGHGDVNGDGRVDIICPNGWWEQPEKPAGSPWKFHDARISDACADMYTYDMTGSGKADILSTSAHVYGFWCSQQRGPNTFVQTSLFRSPFEIAKVPDSARFPYSEDEKALYDAVSKIRSDHFQRAPFALNEELVQMARDHAQRLAAGDVKEANIGGKYPGKVLVVNSKRFAKPAEPPTVDKKKDALSPLQQFALALLPDNEKEKELLQPNFEIGIGAAKTTTGETQYTLLIGDRGLFSLPSQTHALHCVDIDGDGLKDLVTGRRWWAHNPRRGGEGGTNDPAYLYWFQAKRGKDGMVTFTPHMIDDASGVGTSFAVADVNGDGLPDIVVANKKGVHLFLQQR